MLTFSSLIFLFILLIYKIICQNLSSIEKYSTIPIIKRKNIISHNYINNKYSNLKRKLSPSKKNLLLSVVFQFNWDVVQPFFKSFESIETENCECVIVVHGLSEDTVNKIKSFGCSLKEIPSEYVDMRLENIRWKMYADYLNENPDKYNIVLHSDSRDSIFQEDIFQIYDNYDKPFLGVALEQENLTEVVNQEWIKYISNEEVYNKIKNETIICGGTIIATADKFLLLANKVWEKAKKDPYEINIHDQALINYIVYYEKAFDGCLIKSGNKNGKIITLGIVKKKFEIDSENNILNEDGVIAAMAHQYDRLDYFLEKVKKKYCIEGKVNITKRIYKKKVKGKIYSKLFLYVLISIIVIIVIIILFFRLKSISRGNIRKKGYKKYKIIKSIEKERNPSFKFRF